VEAGAAIVVFFGAIGMLAQRLYQKLRDRIQYKKALANTKAQKHDIPRAPK
jgi:hypothetical protein